ncbi:hypothetical protein B6D52_02350 [Candidatus Parcubacteria bacterium 4484_255]|nr:MAG: hypothetical protein B6D52_02350 [Candidatus Parcubacteria bacterium 4484_255]
MYKIPFDTTEEYLNNKDTFKNPAFIEKAFKKAQEKLSIDKIDINKFIKSRDVEKDKEYIKKKENIFEEQNTDQGKENKKIATIAEAILHMQIEENCYLGDDVKTFRACKFDDIKNGVDEILKIEYDNEENLRNIIVAIDITFSINVREKIENIKKGIKRGRLAIIKYLKPNISNINKNKIKHTEAPKLIIGIDKKNLEEVAKLWVEDKNKQLYYHPLHIMVLNEALMQAKHYKNYAKEVGQTKISKKYEELYNIFLQEKQKKEKLIKKILENPENEEKIEEDMVYQSITQA